MERIVDVRKKTGKREFLVKWKGYGPKQNTWEPETNLNCPKLLSAFLKKVRFLYSHFSKYWVYQKSAFFHFPIKKNCTSIYLSRLYIFLEILLPQQKLSLEIKKLQTFVFFPHPYLYNFITWLKLDGKLRMPGLGG